jgi:hypothetical protein
MGPWWWDCIYMTTEDRSIQRNSTVRIGRREYTSDGNGYIAGLDAYLVLTPDERRALVPAS